MQIAKYFASIGFDVDTRGLKKVDKALATLEKKLKKFDGFGNSLSFSIGNFSVDQKKLERVLGNALDIASNRVVLDINKFSVNQTALNQTVAQAMTRAGMAHPLRVTPQVTPPQTVPGAKPSRVREAAVTGVAAGAGRYRGMPSLFGPALALGLGGYGLSNLNERNQQVVSAQLQSQAVVQQAGGTTQEGQQSFQWLRSEGNRIGFNYLDASGDYNKLLSGLTGAGMSVAQGQGVFKGFSELSRVNKLDRVQQQRVYRALSQVAGKNKLQSEELTGQLAESLPGAVSIFAQAYQNQLAAQGKGGGKQGQDAITELLAAMKKGQVKGNILTYAGDVASQRAAPGLAAASTASQAEQARYQNSLNDLAVVASGAGVEEGFARIFRTLNAGLSESGDLVKTLAEGFNEATKWADDLLLFPQSFIRALEGKDSLVADWLGINKTSQLVQDWQTLKQIFTDIGQIKFDFLPTLEATAREIAAILNTIAQIQKFRNGEFPTELSTNTSTVADTTGTIFNNIGVGLGKARERGRAVYDDPTSVYYHDPEGYDAFQRDSRSAQDFDSQNGYSAKQASNDSGVLTNTGNNMQFDITLNVDPVTMNQMDVTAQADALANSFKEQVGVLFEQAGVNFNIKE